MKLLFSVAYAINTNILMATRPPVIFLATLSLMVADGRKHALSVCIYTYAYISWCRRNSCQFEVAVCKAPISVDAFDGVLVQANTIQFIVTHLPFTLVDNGPHLRRGLLWRHLYIQTTPSHSYLIQLAKLHYESKECSECFLYGGYKCFDNFRCYMLISVCAIHK